MKLDPNRSRITRADEEAIVIALSSMQDEEEAAIRAVYMSGPFEKINGHIISLRVRRYAYDRGWSESSVWRMLKKGRRMYAAARGLI